MTGTAMVAKDEEFAVMFAVQYVAYLRPNELCSLAMGQVNRPRSPGSTGGSECLENRRIRREHLVGRRTLGCTRQSAGEIHRRQGGFNTRLEPMITGEIPSRLRQMGRHVRSERDQNSSTLSSARWRVIGCSLENPIVDEDSKTRQMAQRQARQEARETRSSAEGNIEIVRTTRKYGQLMIKHMSKFFRGCLPPPPPVLRILSRNRS